MAAVLSSAFFAANAQQSVTLALRALPETQQQKQDAPAAKPDAKPAEPKKEAEKTIDETVKDFQKIDGILTFYRQKKGTADTLYLEVPESQLGKLMLLQVTSGSGLGDTSLPFMFHGAPIDDIAFRMQKVDEGRIVFFRPNLNHRSTKPEPTRMIERSFPDTILGSFDIKAKQADRKSVLIDVSTLFKSDFADLGAQLDDGSGGGYAINPGSSYIDQLKVFPENAVIRSVFTIMRKRPFGGPKSVPWAVSYNLSALPETGYKPRLGDPRVGYFTTGYEDLTNQSAVDKNVNFIQRWNIEKADPSAAMSPPKKPIVFWLDNSIPLEYRGAVRKGMLAYNAAFEKIGIKDAIVVKQMPDNADWDIADVRYNVVRWTTGMPFAIALFRSNPLTGEILNACINFDGVFASGGGFQYDELINPSSFYDQHEAKHSALGKHSERLCDMQAQSAKLAGAGEVMLDALAEPGVPFNRDEYIRQRLSQVVAHEMGHCLGLRHNFIASTQATMAQLSDPSFVSKHGTAATVMDYSTWNAGGIKKKGVDFYMQGVGPYDLFAIEYGYTPIKSETPQGEIPTLRRIASKGSMWGNLYHSDGTADSYDPFVARFDQAAEPLDWSEKMLKTTRYLLFNTKDPQKGRSYYDFTRAWNAALGSYYNAASFVPRFIGGVQLSNSFHGDPNGKLPITPVDGQRQKRALRLLNTYVFAQNAFSFPKANLAKLTFNPNATDNEESATSRQFNMRDSFATFQRSTLNRLFAPAVLNRIANNEFRATSPNQTLTMASLFQSVGDNVWSELGNGSEISDLRRQLQREHLNMLVNMVLQKSSTTPDDAKTLAYEQLRSLKGRIAAAQPTAKGQYGKAHLNESLLRIQRTLDAPVIAREVGQ
jgi:hypothetical protein